MKINKKPEINIDFTSEQYNSAFVVAPFDVSLDVLERNGYRVISLEENARLRMQKGINSFILKKGNWTKESVIRLRDGEMFLTKISPIIQNPYKATFLNKQLENYFPTEEKIERALSDSIKIPRPLMKVPTNRFTEEELTSYVFGSVARDYGEFLKDKGINGMPVWIANIFGEFFVRQIWFRLLADGSGLYIGHRHLHHNYRLRGIRENKINK